MKELKNTSKEIVFLLSEGEKNQKELCEKTGKSRITIWKTLKKLNDEGVVLYHNIFDEKNKDFVTEKRYKLDKDKVFFRRKTDKYKKDFLSMLIVSLAIPASLFFNFDNSYLFSFGIIIGISGPLLLKIYQLLKTKESIKPFVK